MVLVNPNNNSLGLYLLLDIPNHSLSVRRNMNTNLIHICLLILIW